MGLAVMMGVISASHRNRRNASGMTTAGVSCPGSSSFAPESDVEPVEAAGQGDAGEEPVVGAEAAGLEGVGAQLGKCQRVQVGLTLALRAVGSAKVVGGVDAVLLGELAIAVPAVDDLLERGADLGVGLVGEPPLHHDAGSDGGERDVLLVVGVDLGLAGAVLVDPGAQVLEHLGHPVGGDAVGVGHELVEDLGVFGGAVGAGDAAQHGVDAGAHRGGHRSGDLTGEPDVPEPVVVVGEAAGGADQAGGLTTREPADLLEPPTEGDLPVGQPSRRVHDTDRDGGGGLGLVGGAQHRHRQRRLHHGGCGGEPTLAGDLGHRLGGLHQGGDCAGSLLLQREVSRSRTHVRIKSRPSDSRQPPKRNNHNGCRAALSTGRHLQRVVHRVPCAQSPTVTTGWGVRKGTDCPTLLPRRRAPSTRARAELDRHFCSAEAERHRARVG